MISIAIGFVAGAVTAVVCPKVFTFVAAKIAAAKAAASKV